MRATRRAAIPVCRLPDSRGPREHQLDRAPGCARSTLTTSPAQDVACSQHRPLAASPVRSSVAHSSAAHSSVAHSSAAHSSVAHSSVAHSSAAHSSTA
ncbi:hypothetical protein DN538_15825, partial [Burkholderia multivorans]